MVITKHRRDRRPRRSVNKRFNQNKRREINSNIIKLSFPRRCHPRVELPTRFFASLKNDNVGNTAKDLGGMTNYRLSLRCLVITIHSTVVVIHCKPLTPGEVARASVTERVFESRGGFDIRPFCFGQTVCSWRTTNGRPYGVWWQLFVPPKR